MVRMVVEMGRIVALIVVAVEGLQPIVELFAAFEGFLSGRRLQCSFASICLMLDRI